MWILSKIKKFFSKEEDREKKKIRKRPIPTARMGNNRPVFKRKYPIKSNKNSF